MDDRRLAEYVDAACALQGIALDADERDRVLAQFIRMARIVAPLLALELAHDVEPAPVFHP